MAKFSGPVGFALSSEKAAGVFTDTITARDYVGDIIRASKQYVRDDAGLNDNLTVSNRISIVADDFANANIPAIRYVLWQGVRWKVSNVEIQRPRLILSIGGVYNGPIPTP